MTHILEINPKLETLWNDILGVLHFFWCQVCFQKYQINNHMPRDDAASEVITKARPLLIENYFQTPPLRPRVHPLAVENFLM